MNNNINNCVCLLIHKIISVNTLYSQKGYKTSSEKSWIHRPHYWKLSSLIRLAKSPKVLAVVTTMQNCCNGPTLLLYHQRCLIDKNSSYWYLSRELINLVRVTMGFLPPLFFKKPWMLYQTPSVKHVNYNLSHAQKLKPC